MNKTKKICLWFLGMALVLSLLSCSSPKKEENPPFAEKLYAARLDYVGDNSGVGNLVGLLDFKDFGPYTLSLHTKQEPYGLTVLYSKATGKENTKEDWRLSSSLLLGLIKNLEQVEVITSTNAYLFSAKEISEELGFDIKSIADSQEKLQEYLVQMGYEEKEKTSGE